MVIDVIMSAFQVARAWCLLFGMVINRPEDSTIDRQSVEAWREGTGGRV